MVPAVYINANTNKNGNKKSRSKRKPSNWYDGYGICYKESMEGENKNKELDINEFQMIIKFCDLAYLGYSSCWIYKW